MIGLRATLTLTLLGFLPQCGGDEALAAYSAADIEWQLQQVDGQPYPASATLQFPEDGRISGNAPCNRYFGRQTATYPQFKAEAIGATRRACPDLQAETQYLQALAEMTRAEVVGDTLILSNEAGRELLFNTSR